MKTPNGDYADRGPRRQRVGSVMLRKTLTRFDQLGVEEVALTVRRDNPGARLFWQACGSMIGPQELKQFREPATGRAFLGALSSDFDASDGVSAHSNRMPSARRICMHIHP